MIRNKKIINPSLFSFKLPIYAMHRHSNLLGRRKPLEPAAFHRAFHLTPLGWECFLGDPELGTPARVMAHNDDRSGKRGPGSCRGRR